MLEGRHKDFEYFNTIAASWQEPISNSYNKFFALYWAPAFPRYPMMECYFPKDRVIGVTWLIAPGAGDKIHHRYHELRCPVKRRISIYMPLHHWNNRFENICSFYFPPFNSVAKNLRIHILGGGGIYSPLPTLHSPKLHLWTMTIYCNFHSFTIQNYPNINLIRTAGLSRSNAWKSVTVNPGELLIKWG